MADSINKDDHFFAVNDEDSTILTKVGNDDNDMSQSEDKAIAEEERKLKELYDRICNQRVTQRWLHEKNVVELHDHFIKWESCILEFGMKDKDNPYDFGGEIGRGKPEEFVKMGYRDNHFESMVRKFNEFSGKQIQYEHSKADELAECPEEWNLSDMRVFFIFFLIHC